MRGRGAGRGGARHAGLLVVALHGCAAITARCAPRSAACSDSSPCLGGRAAPRSRAAAYCASAERCAQPPPHRASLLAAAAAAPCPILLAASLLTALLLSLGWSAQEANAPQQGSRQQREAKEGRGARQGSGPGVAGGRGSKIARGRAATSSLSRRKSNKNAQPPLILLPTILRGRASWAPEWWAVTMHKTQYSTTAIVHASPSSYTR